MGDKILFSKIIGDKPQHLIILHGLFGQLDNWNTLGRKFSEFFTVHLLDARNHGRSFHSEEMTHEAMAQDIALYTDAHQIEKTALIGHSLGGKAVMQFALDFPQKAEKLIVADMAPKDYVPHHQSIIKALESVDFTQVKKRSDVEETLKIYIKQIGVRQFLLKNVYRKKDGNYAFRFNLESLSKNYVSLITNHLPNKQFKGETLFLGGEKSAYITPQDEVQIRHYFPQATIDKVSRAGHWLHAENPVEFLEKSLKFLGV